MCISFLNTQKNFYSVNPCKETYKLACAFALTRVTEILMQLTLQVENIFHIFEMR